MVLRDIDILKKIDKEAILPKDIANLDSKVITTFSFSTLDENIAKLFEPYAPSTKRRLNAMKRLKKEGFLVGISLMHMLPYISDTEIAIDEMVSKFKDIEVDYLFGGGLTLYGDTDNDSKIKYYKLLNENFPDIVDDTKRVFRNKEYPLGSYQNKVYGRLANVSKKYNIRNSII